MAELLTDDIIKDKLEIDGIMEEPDAPWLLEYIESEYGGKLNYDKSWADGHEDLIVYTQSTADHYDLYICTESHDNNGLYWDNDVYYYEDHSEWSQRAIETLCNGGDVWVDSCIWDDMEYEFNYGLGIWWSDVYEDLFNELKDELLDSEEYYEDEDDK